MDAVNTCRVCGNPIESALQLVACTRCRFLAHRGCVTGEICRECLSPLDLGATGPSDRQIRNESWGEIRGWLVVLIALTAASAALNLLTGGVMLLSHTEPVWKFWALASIGQAFYGGYCARQLSVRAPSAPKQTAIYLASTIALALIAGAIVEFRGETHSGQGRPTLAAVGWLIYLARSRRVRAVYGNPSFGRLPTD